MSGVRERMIRFAFSVGQGYDRREWVARFWIGTDEHWFPDHKEAKDCIQRAVDAIGGHWSLGQIVNHLGMTVKNCNAVEVLDSRGDGLLMYPSWP